MFSRPSMKVINRSSWDATLLSYRASSWVQRRCRRWWPPPGWRQSFIVGGLQQHNPPPPASSKTPLTPRQASVGDGHGSARPPKWFSRSESLDFFSSGLHNRRSTRSATVQWVPALPGDKTKRIEYSMTTDLISLKKINGLKPQCFGSKWHQWHFCSHFVGYFSFGEIREPETKRENFNHFHNFNIYVFIPAKKSRLDNKKKKPTRNLNLVVWEISRILISILAPEPLLAGKDFLWKIWLGMAYIFWARIFRRY